jgi:hypothetical protein
MFNKKKIKKLELQLKESKLREKELNKIIYDFEHNEYGLKMDETFTMIESSGKNGIQCIEMDIIDSEVIRDEDGRFSGKNVKFILKHQRTYY